MLNFHCPVSKEQEEISFNQFKEWVSKAVYEVGAYSTQLEDITRRKNAALYRAKLRDCGFIIYGYNFDCPSLDEITNVFNNLVIKKDTPKPAVQMQLL